MAREDMSANDSLNRTHHTSPNESFERANNSGSDGKYKTELCRTWVEHNYCPYKDKCRFAHGKKDLHDKMIIGKNFKQKECNSFNTKGYCPYGPRCHFKHDERRLSEIDRIYYLLMISKQDLNNTCFNDKDRKCPIRRLKVFDSIVRNRDISQKTKQVLINGKYIFNRDLSMKKILVNNKKNFFPNLF